VKKLFSKEGCMKKASMWIVLLIFVVGVTIFTSLPVDAEQDLIATKCYNSTQFASENAQFVVDFDDMGGGNHVIRGRLTWTGGDVPLNGILHGSHAVVGVAFLDDAVRSWEISRSTLQGTTWFVDPAGGYGYLQDDTLVPCPVPVVGDGSGLIAKGGEDLPSDAAGPFCFKDVNYTPELHIYLTDSHIHGQAILGDYFGTISGKVRDGWAYFCLNYEGTSSGLRFYVINLSTMDGWTWGIYDSDSTYYDTPHSASLYTCSMPSPAPLGNGSLN
jgi:hypothetical protein